MFHLQKPKLDHLRTMGCLCYATKMNSHDKFEPRTIVAMMMGYSECRKNYILYDITNHSSFVNIDVVFKETVFPFKHKSSKQLHLFAAEKDLVFPLTTPATVHLEDDFPATLDQATETAGCLQ